jgi:hypothetical protein
LPLIQRYYGQAKADGRALRKRVLTSQFEHALSGFFGGNWLMFLDYLEEEPHPEEQIVTALPKTKLYIGTSTEPQEVAAEHSIDEAQLNLILGALYGTGDRSSPVQRRLDVLIRYWKVFDVLHAQQRSGMHPLWGLVEEKRLIRVVDSESPHKAGLYRRLLPTDLLNDIEDCWGTAMLARWPERIVTDPFPHASMAETFGPALKFWQGCALTAWFLCEGPYSRTDMAGLEHYHRREITELENIGTPIDKQMFQELIDGESRLGPPKPIYETINETELDSGIALRTAFSRGSRREGFEQLRDVITKYRRSWADRHLRTRAEGEIHEAVRGYYKSTYDRGGQPPTAKRFAKVAQLATNHWFGGDFGALYRAFGEKSPVNPQRVHLMPHDRELFVTTVYTALGGTRERWVPYIRDENQSEAYMRSLATNLERQALAQMALDYVRLEEALGRKPDLKQFGQRKFEYRARVLDDDLEKAWRLYTAILEKAKYSRDREEGLVDSIEQPSTIAESQDAGKRVSSETREPEQGSNELEPKKQMVGSWFKRLIGR